MADWDAMMAIAGDCVGIFSRRTEMRITTFENQAPSERTVCSSLQEIFHISCNSSVHQNVILNRRARQYRRD